MGTSLDDGTFELDRLFGQVERRKVFENTTIAGGGVAAGGSGGVPNQMTQATADQMDFAGIYGDPEGGAGASTSGLLNGTFISGPPDEASDDVAVIDTDENDLPYWTYAVVAGTWTATWQADIDGPDGFEVEFAQTTGNVSDEAYLEQTIPIDHYRRIVTTIRTKSGDAGMTAKLAVQFLDEDGDAVGSELSASFTNTNIATYRFWREPPALAVEARIRFGCVNTSGVDSQTRSFLFISTEDPTVYSVSIPFVYSFLSPAISTQYAFSYPSDIIPGGVYIPDTQGFVVGISAKTNDTITAGVGTIRAENDTQTSNPGPTVSLTSAAMAANATASLDGDSTYDFEPGDELHMELSTDGTYASTGSADYYGSIRLLLVVNDEGDW